MDFEPSAGLWTTGGSILAAIVASACCWLPLVLLVFGVPAGGVAAQFEKIRPVFIAVSVLLLGAGFYVNYFRREHCEPAGVCTRPNPKLRRVNRSMLWVATAAVLAFALFPNYIGALVDEESAPLGPVADRRDLAVLDVSGMTCESCALTIENALAKLPGVAGASVSYGEGRAVVTLDADMPSSTDALVQSIERVGYQAVLACDSRHPDVKDSPVLGR